MSCFVFLSGCIPLWHFAIDRSTRLVSGDCVHYIFEIEHNALNVRIYGLCVETEFGGIRMVVFSAKTSPYTRRRPFLA